MVSCWGLARSSTSRRPAAAPRHRRYRRMGAVATVTIGRRRCRRMVVVMEVAAMEAAAMVAAAMCRHRCRARPSQAALVATCRRRSRWATAVAMLPHRRCRVTPSRCRRRGAMRHRQCPALPSLASKKSNKMKLLNDVVSKAGKVR